VKNLVLRYRRSVLLASALLAVTAPLALSAAPTAGRVFAVPMMSMRYGQLPGDLRVGDTIIWQNRDGVPHTITARDKSFDIRINPHQTARMTLTKAGSIPFYCIFHLQMRGTLNVAS
jgi:plastocyanin